MNGPDLKLAVAGCEASQWAYAWPATFESSLAHALCREPGRGSPESEFRPHPDPLPQERESAGQGCSVIAFRGTASAEDFLTDGECFRREIGDGISAHAGFYDAIVSISHKLIDWARDARRNEFGQKRFVLTGHSLGGALAMLGAKILSGAGFEVVAVYTFGQPRVWNAAGAAAYEEKLGDRTFRFVNEGDPVPMVPGRLSGNVHAGIECFLPSSGGVVVEPALPFVVWRNAVGAVKSWTHGRLAGLPNHASARYRERLEQELSHAKVAEGAKVDENGLTRASTYPGRPLALS